MDAENRDSTLETKLTTLIVLVSVLIVLAVISLGVSCFTAFKQERLGEGPATVSNKFIESDRFGVDGLPVDLVPKGVPGNSIPAPDKELEQNIRQASAIVLTRNEVREGRVYSFVAEILKRDPSVPFYYEIGDVIGHPMEARSGTTYGEGSIVFCEGSPATMRSSTTIHRGRAPAFGDIPVATLRQIITQSTVAQHGADQPATVSKAVPDADKKPNPE